MLRIFLALVTGGALFAAALGSAAALNLGPAPQLQAGDQPVGMCQGTAPLSLNFSTMVRDIGTPNDPDFTLVVDQVMVSGIEGACLGQRLSLTPLGPLPPGIPFPPHGWQGPPLGPPIIVVIDTVPTLRIPIPYPVEVEDWWGHFLLIAGGPVG